MFAMFAMAALLTACGGKSADSVADDAISQAEQEVQITENAFLGKLPSLYQQMKAAEAKVNEHFKAEMGKSESLQDMSRNGDEKKAAMNKVHKKYYELLETEAKALNGRVVKVSFDTDQITDATAKLRYVEGEITADAEKDSYRLGEPLVIDAELTLAAKLSMQYGAAMNQYHFRDAQGNNIEELAGESIKSDDPRAKAAAGEKITMELPHTPYKKDKATDVDNVWIGFLK